MKTLTPAEVLALPLGEERNDPGADTVRGYLVAMLAKLWRDGGDFSGKRPFGNSGWQCDLHLPLIKAEAIHGALDEDGYIDHCDCREGDRIIAEAIAHLGKP